MISFQSGDPSQNRRRIALLVFQSILGLALLGAWLYFVDIEEIGRTLLAAKWPFVAAGVALGLTSTFIRVQRWRTILKPIASISLLDTWLISAASILVNFVIPLRTGELARSFFLKQRYQIRMATSLPTIAIDRSFDLMAVVLLGSIGALTGIQLGGQLSTILILGAGLFMLIVILIVVAIFAGDRLLLIVERWVPQWLSSTLRDRFLGILKGILAGFMAIGRRPRQLLPLFLISFLATLSDGALYYMLFLSIGANLSPTIVLIGYALFALTFLVPSAPGYVGSMEAFGSLVFGALGVNVDIAASAVVLYHGLNVIVLGINGGLSMWALGLRSSTDLKLEE